MRTSGAFKRWLRLDVWPRQLAIGVAGFVVAAAALAPAGEPTWVYQNKLVPMERPQTILADHPQWVEPIREVVHYEAPALVSDEGADLAVRAL